ncbi:MAG: hypothetical protein M5U01_13365 [Ardenticatenaceae bacterium]|nr:hypothetical protein [Ardenticatenaceae bacterium]
MTLATTIYVPTGIVIAADSRMILSAHENLADGKVLIRQKVISDTSYKLVAVDQPPLGVAIVGHHFVAGQPANCLVERFVAERAGRIHGPAELAELLATEFDERFPLSGPAGFFVESPTDVARALAASFSGAGPRAAPDVGFYIAGYQDDDGQRHPYVAYVSANPRRVQRLNRRPDNQSLVYGAAWAGDRDIVDRLLQNAPLVPFEFMSLDDAVCLAIDLVEVTARMQRWRPTIETVGGPVDVLVVTPEGTRWVRRKRG